MLQSITLRARRNAKSKAYKYIIKLIKDTDINDVFNTVSESEKYLIKAELNRIRMSLCKKKKALENVNS